MKNWRSLLLIVLSASYQSVQPSDCDESDSEQVEKTRSQEFASGHRDALSNSKIATENDQTIAKLMDALIDVCNQALMENPLEPTAHIHLGEALQLRGDFGAAEAEYKAALKLSVSNRNARAEHLLVALPEAKRVFPSMSRSTGAQGAAAENSCKKAVTRRLYLSIVKIKLERAWFPPAHADLLFTRVSTTINDSGKPTGTRIIDSSHNSFEDTSVTDALKSAAVPVPPAGLRLLDLHLTFKSDENFKTVSIPELTEAFDGTRLPVLSPLPVSHVDVDFRPYMGDLQRRIKGTWIRPKGSESKRVIVQFKVHRDGTVSELRIEHSSGMAAADKAALEAVQNAKLAPLQAGAPDTIEIQFKFDDGLFDGREH